MAKMEVFNSVLSNKSPKKPVRKLNKLTLLDLVSNTPETIKKNSLNDLCRVNFKGNFKKKNSQVFAYTCGCSGRPHTVLVEFLNTSEKAANCEVIVQCTCEYFIYTLEVVLASRGMSHNEFALPQWPVVKNPAGSMHACKHIILVVNDAVTRYDSKDTSKRLNPYETAKLKDSSFNTARKMARY